MAGPAIPIMFTLPPSNRHEIIMVDPADVQSMKALNKVLTMTIKNSPNCAEFMGKYKNKDQEESIQEIKVHWSDSGRDRKVWPEYTIVTEDNLEAVLELLRIGVGRDVLEVKVDKPAE